jgi:hypothetical protein
MDKTHLIDFEVINKRTSFENDLTKKLIQLRDESQRYDVDKKLKGFGQFVFLGFAVYGGLKFLESVFDE